LIAASDQFCANVDPWVTWCREYRDLNDIQLVMTPRAERFVHAATYEVDPGSPSATT